ncbi:MAG: tetratricopeptide repeat protein [Saprospiraceae bacterium]|nr:tetratricopeptide repeat protein [Saprospiraceae bacterium]
MAKKNKKAASAPAPPSVKTPAVAKATVAVGTSLFERPWLPQLILVAAVVAVYAASLDNGLVFFDDDKAILYNHTLQNPSLAKFFSGQNLGMYAPLSWMAYWVGSLISGQEAWGYHLLSLVLHALNATLVFTLLKQLTNKHWAAFFAALLFAVHPVQVEAVSWAAALSTVLFSTFYLCSVLAYLHWRRSSATTWIGLSLLAFAAACLSKSAAVTLPLVLVAIDYYLSWKNQLGKSWLSKVPYFAIALAFGLYTFVTREQEGHDIEATSAAFTALDRFFMVCQTLLFYPVKMLLPFGFSISYPFVKIGGAWDWTYYAAPLVLIALAFFVWKKWRDQPNLLLGVGLYLLPLAVMLPFRTVGSFELRSDRYVYLSCVGLFFIAGVFLEKTKAQIRNGIMVALAAVLGFLAFKQTAVWENGVALFNNCTEKTPESALCQCNLAYNQLLGLDFQGAIRHYSEALKYDPTTIEAYNGRGQAYFQMRQIPEAFEDFNNAIKAGLSSPKLFLNRGKCHVMLNRPKEAIPDLTRSLELEPKSAEAHYFRAFAREKTGDPENAIRDYGSAIQLNPNYVEALVNRGLLRYTAGQLKEAITDYSEALKTAAQQVQPMILNNRANAYLQAGQLNEALDDVNRALAVNPQYPRAYQTRSAVYNKLGQPAKAQADLQVAQQMTGR